MTAIITTRECERLRLQERLDAAKTQAERNRMGQFATPPDLAKEIIAEALSLLPADSPVRFLDPGFGTGSFYSALLDRVSPTRIESATGYEIDAHYGEAAKRLWIDSGLRLRLVDFTRAEPPQSDGAKFNFVICNPPYVRHHHLTQEQKGWLRRRASVAGIEMNGLSGLYTYFMVLSKAWMSAGGVAAWLVPSEFMDVNYGRKVKQFLLEHVTLCRIHRFDPAQVQFGDALVSSAVVFFSSASPPAGHEVEFSFGGTLARPKLVERVQAAELRRVAKWTGLPGGGRSAATGEKLHSLFKINRGLATGCNSFFTLAPEEAERWKLPAEFLAPILPSPRHLDQSELAADSRGVPLIKNRRFLLSCDLPERDVRRRHPPLWRYLQSGMAAGIHERYLCRHRDPWYSQERRPPAPFLCTYMGRATARSDRPFRFILNRSQATATNLYLMLYPRPALAALLAANDALYRAVWQALTGITAAMLASEGRVYGGGLHKIEPKELGNVSADIVWQAIPPECRCLQQRELFD